MTPTADEIVAAWKQRQPVEPALAIMIAAYEAQKAEISASVEAERQACEDAADNIFKDMALGSTERHWTMKIKHAIAARKKT